MSANNTYDGSEVAVEVAGFDSYTTRENGSSLPNNLVFNTGDVLAKLRALENKVSSMDLNFYIKVLQEHVANLDNPHKTSLTQFTYDVGDVLYTEYVAQGGTGGREEYLNNLFSTLRLATLTDLETGEDDTAIISIFLAKQLFSAHESDANAHSLILDELYPGTPVEETPLVSFDPMFEVPESMMDYKALETDHIVPYSYIGEDGYLHHCSDPGYLPVDYSQGYGLIPCFGLKTNEITQSQDLSSFPMNNVSILAEAEMAPDKTYTATAIFLSNDLSTQEHYLSVPDITLVGGKAKVFSLFAKKDACRYLYFSFRDSAVTTLETIIVFDLQEGLVVSANHLNRYSGRMVELKNGYWRCEMTLLNNIGRVSDLKVGFLHGYTGTLSTSFIGDGELAGYVWGLQLESGEIASPYMPTNGTIANRNPVGLKQVFGTGWDTQHYSVYVDYKNPGTVLSESSTRPLLASFDANGDKALLVQYDTDGSLSIRHFDTFSSVNVVTTVYEDSYASTDDTYCQFTHTLGGSHVRTGYNQEILTNTAPPDDYNTTAVLYIGNNGTDFIDGYVRNFCLYNSSVSTDQITFLHAEQLYV